MAELPEGYQCRALSADDFDKGYLALLGQLTVAGEMTKERFAEQIALMERCMAFALVIEHLETKQVVGTATVLIEPKIIRSCAFVGHIEDVVVSSEHRGKRLGEFLVCQLVELAKVNKCYKVILDCADKMEGFYARCGFYRKEIQMRCDVPLGEEEQNKTQ